MLGKVIAVFENNVEVELTLDHDNVKKYLNYHVVFDEENFKIVGEVKEITNQKIIVNCLGEINSSNKFVPGLLKKPSLGISCRIIHKEELDLILGKNENLKKIYFGRMPIYDGYPLYVNVNDFFAHHFAIFGNTGSGKSCSIARIIQNVFADPKAVPKNAKIFIFDAYGEYHSAFNKIMNLNPALNFKTYTTNTKFEDTNILKIPLWLLGVDEICLLLGVDNHAQIPIIEKALKLVNVFARDESNVIQYKNDIIARALLEILYSGATASKIRDHFIAILTNYNTRDLDLEAKIIQPGYTRTLKQCLIIDRDGKLHEIQLLTEFLNQFIHDGLELSLPDGSFPYTLKNLKEAVDFALISEGILKSDKVYDYANVLKVRINSLFNSNNRHYFQYDRYVTKEQYIKELIKIDDTNTAQIINFNINYVDDRFAKVITKIYAKLLLDYVYNLNEKGSFPVHLILEEAHRYVQKDSDVELLGYNIFDRITKEGRKYGILLGLISQRPSELSDTALSQCSNFLIFKMVHPQDTTYVKNMVPSITNEIVERLKSLQPGTCISFGKAFPIPTIIHFDIPDPQPKSTSSDIGNLWYK